MLANIRFRLRAIFRRRAVEDDLDDELRNHFELEANKYIARGIPASEAKRRARIAIGGVDQIKEQCRDARGIRLFDDLVRDVRYALRTILRSPRFTTVAVITLAAGIGLNTAMFSILNTLVLRPLPFPEPGRVFRLDRVSAEEPEGTHRAPNYLEIDRQTRDVADLAAYSNWGHTLTDAGSLPQFIECLRVSARFFDVFRIQPALGRTFRPEEDTAGGNGVIMLSDAFWRSRYNADPSVIGRVVRLDAQPVEIVGVLPASAEVRPLFGVMGIVRPLGLTDEEQSFQSETFFQIVGRYRPGVSPAEAQAHFDIVARRLAADRPQENTGLGLRAVPVQNAVTNNVVVTITFLLVGLSGFVLLIACANLANLLMARALTRSREFAMRAALGASSTALVRSVALECLLLAGAGALASVLLAVWITGWLERQLSGDGPPEVFALDWRVLTFGIATALVTTLLVSVAPAWAVLRVNVNETLKSATRGVTGSASQHRFRNALIVGQVALTLVLLAGAAAFARGIHRLVPRDRGWEPERLLTGRIPLAGHDDERERLQFFRLLHDRLAALPGVESASIDLDLPLYGFLPGQRAYVVEGRARPTPGQEPTALTNLVSPEYFETVATPIIRGRAFLASDKRDSPRVVVINEAMANALFAGGDAIGQRLGRVDKEPEWAEIVGIARDVRFVSLGGLPTRFQLYKPLSQEPWGFVLGTVRIAHGISAAALIEPFRRAVAELDPNLAVLNLMPVPALIAEGNRDLVIVNQLLAGFAGLGLFLAAVGLYGVITRLVTQRTIEIGIRVALGATFPQVVHLVLATGVRMMLLGVAVGLFGAVTLTRMINSELPGIASNNALTISAAAVLLFVVSLLACYLPARRAARVDPVAAIRSE